MQKELRVESDRYYGYALLTIILLASLLLAKLYPIISESENIIEVYQPDYLDSYIKQNRVLIIFSSETCLECIKLKQKYHELRELLPKDILIVEVPFVLGLTDDIFNHYNIVRTPTLVLYSYGDFIARYEPLVSPSSEEIFKWVLDSLESQKDTIVRERSKLNLTSLSYIGPLVLGFLIAYSPCSIPFVLLVTSGYLREASSEYRIKRFLKPYIFFIAGILSSLMVFALAFKWLSTIIFRSLLFLAFFLIFTGIASIFQQDIYPKMRPLSKETKGIYFLSGFFALQCNIPLFLGAAAVISYSVMYTQITTMLTILLGVITAYTIAMWIGYRLIYMSRLYGRIVGLSKLLSGLLFLIIGVIIIII